ncbi:hypothetical protein [Clostridium haemolyticum]|uniref:Uncharacterized protein n=1 Tax=Clostridium haemolyticum NCTC 9693 TaxID=1443114 RepID=A0ABR4TB32_CLOHA|nr:hypothetical protein [Clostridium haemolyticum]KEI14128.1 hypothetical protein Z960_p0135 [Clostridium haemolyticum NCTC 9693]
MNIIKTGHFTLKNENLCGLLRSKLTNVVHYSIYKNPIKFNDYKLEFECIYGIRDFWKREQSPRYEMTIYHINFLLHENNNSMFKNNNFVEFENYLYKNIDKYYVEITQSTNRLNPELKRFFNIEEIINDEDIQRDFKILHVYDKDQIRNRIVKKIMKAY